jgi:hypothetical protein
MGRRVARGTKTWDRSVIACIIIRHYACWLGSGVIRPDARELTSAAALMHPTVQVSIVPRLSQHVTRARAETT